MTTDDFRSRLRAERARLGLTQEEAAGRCAMSVGVYRQLEQRGGDVPTSTLAKLVEGGYRLRVIAPELVS
jgi:transcriptional regulator with XRE-family HTH domain